MKVTFHKAIGGKEFVGIQYSHNDISVFYPETFRWKNNAKAEAIDSLSSDTICGIRTLLASIAWVKTHSKVKSSPNDTSNGEEPFALLSYRWLIRDYMQNGTYKNRETVYKTNQKGKLNWKRTISKLPLYSDGNFIYKDLVVSTKSVTADLIAEIYLFCVKKSLFLAGWLFGIRSSSLGVKRMADVELSPAVKMRYLYAVRQELSRTFDDEKKLRLTHMKNVLLGLNTSKDGQLVYGVDSFDHVFEAAVDRVFGTEEEKEPFYPFGQWSNGEKASHLRVDSVLRQNDTYVIIDAKCYRYGVDGFLAGNCDGLPGTDSIQKQITYGDHLYKKNPAAKIHNCFLIPYAKTTDAFLHDPKLYAFATWRSSAEEYEQVHVFLVDMRDLLEKAQFSSHQQEQEDLLNLLAPVKVPAPV